RQRAVSDPGEIDQAIAVEIGGGEALGGSHDSEPGGSSEGAVAMIEEDRDVERLVDACQIEPAVAIDVRRDDPRRRPSRRQTDLRPERPVAVPEDERKVAVAEAEAVGLV